MLPLRLLAPQKEAAITAKMRPQAEDVGGVVKRSAKASLVLVCKHSGHMYTAIHVSQHSQLHILAELRTMNGLCRPDSSPKWLQGAKLILMI